MNKFLSVDEIMNHIHDGMTLMIGGFLGVGTPHRLIQGLLDSGKKDLTIICNDTGYPDKGIGLLIVNHRVRKVIVSHIGTNPHTGDQMNQKTLLVEFSPQGTLAERIRAGGAGLGGILTPTGLGTVVAEGKQTIPVDGRDYLLELPLRADVALVAASRGDAQGNLIYRGTAENFNPLMATAASYVVAEIENLVEVGSLAPETVRTPGIFIHHILK